MLRRVLTFHMQRSWLRTIVVAVVVAAIVAPVTALAHDRFSDVPSSHTFHNDITWLADNDVTRGCNPPENTRFCPDREVTRGQMAAFMKRLATGRVVDAGKLDGRDGSLFAKVYAFYTIEGPPDTVEALGGGDYIGSLSCAPGDVGISGGYIEEPDQFVWSEATADDGFVAGWYDDGAGGSSNVYMFARCLDVNGNNTRSSASSSSTSSDSPLDLLTSNVEQRTGK